VIQLETLQFLIACTKCRGRVARAYIVLHVLRTTFLNARAFSSVFVSLRLAVACLRDWSLDLTCYNVARTGRMRASSSQRQVGTSIWPT